MINNIYQFISRKMLYYFINYCITQDIDRKKLWWIVVSSIKFYPPNISTNEIISLSHALEQPIRLCPAKLNVAEYESTKIFSYLCFVLYGLFQQYNVKNIV